MSTLTALDGTKWQGTAELWLDPLGDEVQRSECTLAVDAKVVSYTWRYDGQPHRGTVSVRDGGADFCDTWHQPESMRCDVVPGAWGLIQVTGRYGPDADWGWRIALVLRAPTDQLVLQMTNIAPWGEEARAVRMTFDRTAG